MLALFFFDSGANRSFVSLTLGKKFDVDLRELDFPLEVEIADNCIVIASRVHRDCVLEMFQVWFPIDLVPISLIGAIIIVGIYYLSRFGTMINCGII